MNDPYFYVRKTIRTMHILAICSKTNKNHKILSKPYFVRISYSLPWCLLETSDIKIGEIWRFRVYLYTCTKIGVPFCMATFNVLSAFNGDDIYILITCKVSIAYWLHSKVDNSPVFTLPKKINNPWGISTITFIKIGYKIAFV